jgi:hypothetical protein
MVTVSVVEGTKGLVGSKTSVVGVMRCHVPATGGDRVGIGVVAANGIEVVTVMVLSDATAVAPAAGVVLTTVSGTLLSAVAWAAVADEPVGEAVGEASAVVAVNRMTAVDTPATNSAATTTSEMTSAGWRLLGRRCPWARCGGGFFAGIVLSVGRYVTS